MTPETSVSVTKLLTLRYSSRVKGLHSVTGLAVCCAVLASRERDSFVSLPRSLSTRSYNSRSSLCSLSWARPADVLPK